MHFYEKNAQLALTIWHSKRAESRGELTKFFINIADDPGFRIAVALARR